MRFILLLLLFCTLPGVILLSAQDETGQRGDLWVSLGGDTAFYSISGIAYGGNFAFGYGTGISIGLKAAWFFGPQSVDTLEFNFLFRLYVYGSSSYYGPFIQIMGGPSFYNFRGGFSIPSDLGMISAGLSFGWRFLFIDRLFVEPAIRVGYPYIAGAGVSAGVRF
jgi:hypothetical protein